MTRQACLCTPISIARRRSLECGVLVSPLWCHTVAVNARARSGKSCQGLFSRRANGRVPIALRRAPEASKRRQRKTKP